MKEKDSRGGNADEKTLRILLVDDEADVRGSLAMLLGIDGYSVTEAKSGLEALRLIKQNDFDLILTDYRMGEMNGDVLAAEVKKLDPELPIWMLTGFAPGPPGPDNPVDGIINKPCSLADLRMATAHARHRKGPK